MTEEFARKLIQEVTFSYNTIADHFTQTRQEPWPEFSIVPSFLKKKETLLDVGCGNGRLGETARECNAQYIGVDIATAFIEEAKQAFPEFEFHVGSALELPIDNESVDHVAAIASLQHVPSATLQLQALQEMHRVCKPGGTLFMTNWNLFQPVLPDYFTPAKEAFGEEYEEGDALVPWRDTDGTERAQRYYHGFTESELADLLERAGWNVTKQWYQARGEIADSKEGFNLITLAQK